jgi:hypothetical protein
MVLEIVSESDMSITSLRKRGEKFILYAKFVEIHLEELKYNMKRLRETTYRDRKENYSSNKKNEDYIIKEEILREMLDERLRNNGFLAIQRGLQYHLWKHDIVVITELRLSGKRNFRFRKKTKYDFLSPALRE